MFVGWVGTLLFEEGVGVEIDREVEGLVVVIDVLDSIDKFDCFCFLC